MDKETKQTTVICEEIFDDTSHPSVSEIHEYASKLGIDPASEPQLLPLAVEGLMKPLPSNWKPCFDDHKKAYYYHNKTTGKTQWEHPLDNVYRDLITRVRTESQSLSLGETEDATYTRDDIPSYEEPFVVPSSKLSPLKHRPKLSGISDFAKRSLDDTSLKGVEVLKVSGGGSMFLKSNTKTPCLEDATCPAGQKLVPHLRGILRDNPDSDKTTEEDDKKSVRFNMEAAPNFLYFTVSDDSETESNKIQSVDETLVPAVKSRFTVTPVKENEFKEGNSSFFRLLEIDGTKDSRDLTIHKPLNSVNADFESPKSLNCEAQVSFDKLEADFEERVSLETAKLEERLVNRKAELETFYQAEEARFAEELALKIAVRKREFEEEVIKMERELDKKKDELIVSHNAILDQIRQNHAAVVSELQQDYKTEEEIIRREHHKLISELKSKTSAEKNSPKEPEEERLFEKVRCEKRLLEDKYRCLKDKYLKLKTEVKLSIEKRNRKKEQNLTTTTNTTGSETEKSPVERKESVQQPHSPASHKRPPKSSSQQNSHHKFRRVLAQDQDTSASDASCVLNSQCDSSDLDLETNPSKGTTRKKAFTRLKSRLNNNVKTKESQRACSPVENLRKQLQKLEDLEDQFPHNSDTYHLRYPFSDGQIRFEGSSELEFFRHRIHLERDSIRRARDGLRKQKSHFKQRQDELRVRRGQSARNTLKQLCQEEKELTDMEVSLHRTRSLLGEKVIRLRHLEQSLHRASTPNDHQQTQEDATLSDLSSHSASSGISSSDFVIPDVSGRVAQFKESSEIIQSLENLNLEIQEIWDVLNKQHSGNVPAVFPTLPLLYPDLSWPILAATAAQVPPSIPTLADRLQNYRQHVALANAQSTVVTHDTQGATTTLVEKTRNLRQWLRQTTIDAATDGNIPEASL